MARPAPAPLELRNVELRKGDRVAVAKLARFTNGWEVLEVFEAGYEPRADRDGGNFSTREEAERQAFELWSW